MTCEIGRVIPLLVLITQDKVLTLENLSLVTMSGYHDPLVDPTSHGMWFRSLGSCSLGTNDSLKMTHGYNQ